MSTKRIVFENPETGTLSVVIPAPNSKKSDESESEWLDRVTKLAGVDKLPTKVVNESELPDRYFRDAWKFDSSKGAKVSPSDAIKVKQSKVRSERAEKFAELDAEWMKYKGQGNEVEAAKVEAKRQKLRDAPDDIKTQLSGKTDLEEIKNAEPVIFKDLKSEGNLSEQLP